MHLPPWLKYVLSRACVKSDKSKNYQLKNKINKMAYTVPADLKIESALYSLNMEIYLSRLHKDIFSELEQVINSISFSFFI